MTEVDWLNCRNPMPMLAFLRGKASERKLRLFATACCRHRWHFLTDERSRNAVEVAEKLAEGLATSLEQELAAADAEQAVYDVPDGPVQWTTERASAAAAEWTLASDPDEAAVYAAHWTAQYEQEMLQRQAECLRDVFGNPFRRVTLDSDWLTPSCASTPRIGMMAVGSRIAVVSGDSRPRSDGPRK